MYKQLDVCDSNSLKSFLSSGDKIDAVVYSIGELFGLKTNPFLARAFSFFFKNVLYLASKGEKEYYSDQNLQKIVDQSDFSAKNYAGAVHLADMVLAGSKTADLVPFVYVSAEFSPYYKFYTKRCLLIYHFCKKCSKCKKPKNRLELII